MVSRVALVWISLHDCKITYYHWSHSDECWFLNWEWPDELVLREIKGSFDKIKVGDGLCYQINRITESNAAPNKSDKTARSHVWVKCSIKFLSKDLSASLKIHFTVFMESGWLAFTAADHAPPYTQDRKREWETLRAKRPSTIHS